MGEEMCCGCTSLNADDEYDMGMHVAAIFIVFIVAGTGSMVPIISRMIPQSKANSVIMESVSAFSYGVVVATALIHMISEGIEKLSSECLGPIVEEYESWGLAIVMITLLIMHLIECESTVFFGDEGSAHGHGPSNGEDTVILGENLPSPHSVNHPYQKKSMDEGDGSSKLSRKIATLIFEAGVIFHSVIIGVNLGVASGPGFKTLLAALSFHQFFEGIAIGSSALKTVESKSKLLTVNFAFALTTPAGLGFGILVRNSYSKSSTTALWVEGVLACVAGGILLYTGIVELMTYNMTTNGQFMSRPTAQRFTLYFSMWAGAGVMALLGKWA